MPCGSSCCSLPLCRFSAPALRLSPAAATTPPRVEGYSCSAMLSSLPPSKVWRTSFRGHKRDLNTGFFWPHAATACFTSQKDCKAWLYWEQSDWPDQNTFTPCRRVG